MVLSLATAAMAAVLVGNEVVLVQAAPPAIVRRAPLPGRGLAVFAAPDGRVLVPLAARDGTAVVTVEGPVRSWQGRLFPLFFDEIDRMLLVFPGSLATVSFPDRVVIDTVQLDGVGGAWRAACSADGRLAAIVPVDDRRLLLLTAVRGGGFELRAPLAGDAEAVTVSTTASFAVAGLAGGELQLVVPNGPTWLGSAGAAGQVTGLVVSTEDRYLVAGLASGDHGAVAVHRIDARKKEPIRHRSLTELPSPVLGVALSEDVLFALTRDGVTILTRTGRRLAGRVDLAGGTGVAALPRHPRAALPEWTEP